jgi:putative transposase
VVPLDRGELDSCSLEFRLLERLHEEAPSVAEDCRLDEDDILKATTMLARTKSVIVLDNLDVKEMAGRHSIAKKVMDAAMAEAAKQLEYKTKWYGSMLYIAAWWYPFTKRCSRCGNVKDNVGLSERVYRCAVCGLMIDRDLNAARNLEQWPRVARTLKTPLERGKPYVEATPPNEGGIKSPNGGLT